MKKLFTLLLFANVISLTAQITYVETDGPDRGLTIFSREFADISLLNLDLLMEAGGDKNWDVRGTYNENAENEFVGTQNLHFKNRFPGANLARVEKPNLDSTYQMMEKNNFGLFLLGTRDSVSEIVFVPKFMVLPYPLSFGMNYQNDVSAEYKVGNVNFKIDYLKTNSTVEAWGTMRTNDGNFPVIKVKTKEISEISADGVPIGSSTVELHSWLTSGLADPLVELRSSETEINSIILTDTTLTNTYQQIFVRNEDVYNPEIKLSITPNPVSNHVSIICKNVNYNSGTYSIINAEGKIVLDGNLKANESLQLNLNQLVSGNYLVQLILDKKTILFDIISKR